MSSSASYSLPGDMNGADRSAAQAGPLVVPRLFHTADGGEIEIVGGLITMSDGLETAVYLSLFGGNERDSGIEGDAPLQWWGNLTEAEAARQYRSETQHLVRSLPAIPANLRRIEDAVMRDLAWMDGEIARGIEALASIPARNRVQIDLNVEVAGGTKHTFQFAIEWGTSRS